MSDRKERYEILFEDITHKMDLVLEGYSEMSNKFEEARKERNLIRDHLTHKIEFVVRDMNRKMEVTRDELRKELKETRDELREELKETRDELREELGGKIDKIGRRFEDHEVRIGRLEREAAT